MGIAWSLGIEEKFYLLWPMVFVAFAGRWAKLFKCCLAGVGLVWLNKLVLMHVVHPPYRYFEYAFDTRVDVILAGCALALATRLPKAQAWFAFVASRPGWMLPTIGLLIETVVAVSPENRALIPAYFTYVMAAQVLLLPNSLRPVDSAGATSRSCGPWTRRWPGRSATFPTGSTFITTLFCGWQGGFCKATSGSASSC